MLGFELLWFCIGTVALEAQSIRGLGPQQVIVLAAMRLVTGSASLLERWLVVHAFLAEVRDVAVAAQADIHSIRSWQPRLRTGMGAMAVGAIARGSRMRHFGALDGLGFIVVASYAKRLGIGLRQHHFSVFCRSMANVALFVCKRRMHKLRHQLGSVRLVRVVATQAICFIEGLVLVRLLQVRPLGIVAIQTQGRRGLRQMEIKLRFSRFSGLVGYVAGVTTHIDSGMTATFRRNIRALTVATQAEIVLLISGRSLQQLILIV